MNDKMNILLKQIKLEEELYSSFNDAVLEKVVVNKRTNGYTFVIHKNKLLKSDEFFYFFDLLKKAFLGIKEVNVKFVIDEVCESYIEEYYPEILKRLKDKLFLWNLFLDNLIRRDGSYLIIVNNKEEEKQINSILSDINNYLLMAGFNFKLNVLLEKSIVSDSINNELESINTELESLEVSKTVEKKKDYSNMVGPRKERDESSVIGRIITDNVISIKDVKGESNNVTVEGYIFGVDLFESSKSNFKIITLKITDYTDSIYCKVFVRDDDEYIRLQKELKVGSWFKFNGGTKDDIYSKELVLNVRDANRIEKPSEERMDIYPEKRVELHSHTMMSQMDGVIDEVKLVKQAMAWGHKAIAITDHDGCQAFPHVYNTVCGYNKGKEDKDKFKALYGVEIEMSENTLDVVMNSTDSNLLNSTYVIFDTETTGFNPGLNDSMIEIGAVKMQDGIVLDSFDELINPGHKIDREITLLTGITDEMVSDKDNEEVVVKKFKEWIGNLPLVAHNAKFDRNMLSMAYSKYNLGPLNNPILDTMVISQLINKNLKKHNLTALAKNYSVMFEESKNDDEDDDVEVNESHHHRADYDAENTGYIFVKMLKQIEDNYPDIKTLNDLNNLPTKEDINRLNREFHINILAKTRVGLKNMFKIISFANCKYIVRNARVPRYIIDEYREDLLIGSGCYNSEIFKKALTLTDDELKDAIKFYDYVEVQPKDNYTHLIARHDINNMDEVEFALNKIVRCAIEANVMVVATCDCHTLRKDDKISREIIVNQNVPGKGRHPLARYLTTSGYESIPDQYFRTTDEMMDAFSFLPEDIRHKIIIDNPNKIADMCDFIEVIIATDKPFSPIIENSDQITKDMVYDKAHSIYGDPLPEIIEKRIEDELHGIIGGGFDVIYLIAQKLVKHSNDDGYLVGSRGSVGSSFVATMMGITEVNSLPAHYVCPNCKHSIFELDGTKLGSVYSSGFDLPDMMCPKCNTRMNKDGQDMPFATFLGFNADKVPDIDLNFSGDNQASAHEYTKVLFGVDNVYRAGTIGTVADKTAYGYVLGYFEDKELAKGKKILNSEIKPLINKAKSSGKQEDIIAAENMIDIYYDDARVFQTLDQITRLRNELRKAGNMELIPKDKSPDATKKREIKVNKRSVEIERISVGCTGVKRTTGQHPGGIVVVPKYMDVYDFTPYQFPADDVTAAWRTTHFDYHAIDQDLLKLDILGHDDPTVLRMLQDLSGMDVTKVPLDDKDTMSIFMSPNILGVTEDQIMCPTGTLGIPEFGTKFVIQMLVDTKPKTFSELIKISGLSHGTDVWLGNAQDLIKNNVVPFKEVIGCRDDIMVYLMYHGIEPLKAFKIMEFVRKGRATKDPETWKTWEKEMKDNKIADWFIESCHKIKYMFPKAHAAAYVTSAYRIAWFKVHHPIWYYAAYFSIRCDDFDISAMTRGYNSIKNRILEIRDKGYSASNKEVSTQGVLELCLEASARGIKFANVDLYKSDASKFIIEGDDTLIPPFRTIDGLGGSVANAIVEARKEKPFISIQDLQTRGKVSKALIEKMQNMGIIDLPETNQLTLF